MTSLGGAIFQITMNRGETKVFSVRVPEEGKPQYVYVDDPENPVDVPDDIVAQAAQIVAENPDP
jgi:hypothetical protein